jgi:hypothetical protein
MSEIGLTQWECFLNTDFQNTAWNKVQHWIDLFTQFLGIFYWQWIILTNAVVFQSSHMKGFDFLSSMIVVPIVNSVFDQKHNKMDGLVLDIIVSPIQVIVIRLSVSLQPWHLIMQRPRNSFCYSSWFFSKYSKSICQNVSLNPTKN